MDKPFTSTFLECLQKECDQINSLISQIQLKNDQFVQFLSGFEGKFSYVFKSVYGMDEIIPFLTCILRILTHFDTSKLNVNSRLSLLLFLFNRSSDLQFNDTYDSTPNIKSPWIRAVEEVLHVIDKYGPEVVINCINELDNILVENGRIRDMYGRIPEGDCCVSKNSYSVYEEGGSIYNHWIICLNGVLGHYPNMNLFKLFTEKTEGDRKSYIESLLPMLDIIFTPRETAGATYVGRYEQWRFKDKT